MTDYMAMELNGLGAVAAAGRPTSAQGKGGEIAAPDTGHDMAWTVDLVESYFAGLEIRHEPR